MARQRERDKRSSSFRRETTSVVTQEEFMQNGGTLRGLIVDENGRDVLYLRKADEGGRFTSCFSKVWFNPINEEEKEMDDRGLKPGSICCPHIQEIPLLPPACHHAINFPDDEIEVDNKPMKLMDNPPKIPSGPSNYAPPPLAVPPKQNPPPPPPPPLVRETQPPLPPQPPPPPPLSTKQISKPPAPPQPPPPPIKKISKPPAAPISSKTRPGSLTLPPKPSGVSGAVKSTAPPTSHNRAETQFFENLNDKGDIQMKLKPLHWDKVPTNVDHSMVWHEINDGSFR